VFLEDWMLCCRATPQDVSYGNDDFTEPYTVYCDVFVGIFRGFYNLISGQ